MSKKTTSQTKAQDLRRAVPPRERGKEPASETPVKRDKRAFIPDSEEDSKSSSSEDDDTSEDASEDTSEDIMRGEEEPSVQLSQKTLETVLDLLRQQQQETKPRTVAKPRTDKVQGKKTIPHSTVIPRSALDFYLQPSESSESSESEGISSNYVRDKRTEDEEMRNDPGIFINEAAQSFYRIYAKEQRLVARKYRDVGESDNITKSRYTFKLGNGRPSIIVYDKPRRVIGQVIEENLIIPYYLLTLFDTKSEAEEFINALPRELDQHKQLVEIWLADDVNWDGTLKWDMKRSKLRSDKISHSPHRHRSHGVRPPPKRGRTKESSKPHLHPKKSALIKEAREKTKGPETKMKLTRPKSVGDAEIREIPGSQIQIVERELLNAVPLSQLKHELKDPMVLFNSRRNDTIMYRNNTSKSIITLANNPAYAEFKDYFDTVSNVAYISGVFRTYTYSVKTKYKPTDAIARDRYDNLMVTPTLPKNKSWEGVEFMLVKSDVPTYDPINLGKALQYTMRDDAPNDKGKAYYHVFIEYASYDEEFHKFSTQEFLVGKFTREGDRWMPGNLTTHMMYKAFDKLEIHTSLSGMLNAAGSDADLSSSIFLLTKRIIVKVVNFLRSGGDNEKLLSMMLTLVEKKKKKEGVRDNKPFKITDKQLKENETIEVAKGGLIIGTTSSGLTLTTKPTLSENDCFFSAILPFIKKKWEDDAKLKAVKATTCGYKALRKEFNKKMNYPVDDTSKVSIEDASVFAAAYDISLYIINENRDVLNRKYVLKYNNPKWVMRTVMLYNNHYLTVHALHEQKLALLNSVMTPPELKDENIMGHDLYVTLRAHIDFETIYDENTVEQSMRTYSVSLALKWGKIKTKVREASRGDLFRKAADNWVQEKAGEPVTFIDPHVSEQTLMSKVLTHINNTVASSGNKFKPFIDTNYLHEVKINVVFIAHNGAKFDFMPIFRTLSDGDFMYDKSIPVSASGKMTRFKFWERYETIKDVWDASGYYKSYQPRVQKSYSVWDTNCFLTGSLKKLLESYGIKNGKLDFDHEKVQKESKNRVNGEKGYDAWEDFLIETLKPKLVAYNERDVTALAELVDLLDEGFTELGIDMFQYATIAGLAYAHAQKMSDINYESINVELPSFDLEESANLSLRIQKAKAGGKFKETGRTFKETLSKNTPDAVDLLIRKGVIAGRVSSGAGVILYNSEYVQVR